MRKILLVILSIFLFSCAREAADSGSSASSWQVADKDAVPVFTGKVVREPFVTGVEASGIIEGIREAEVVSETSGLITSMNFEIGEYVESGDVLLKVEDRLAGISFDSAGRDYEAVQIEFEALEKSFKTGGTSQLLYSQGRARLEAARLRMEQARKVLDDTAVKAPFSGYISSRDSSIAEGSYLQSSRTVAHIADLSAWQIRLSLGESEISLVKPGDEAAVRINALPGKEFPARVKAVSPGSRSGGGGFPVLVSWSDGSDPSLKSGMSASVLIRPDYPGPSQIIVPEEALVRRDSQDYVFRVRDGAAEAVPVRVLQSLGNRVSVAPVRGEENFLQAGEDLIISGLSSLVPGDPVLPSSSEENEP